MIESLIKEFEEMKQKRKTRIELEQKILEEQNNNNINNNTNINNINQPKEKEKLKDSIQKYEPIEENQTSHVKPPIPSVNDTPILLPKINKNY